MHLVYTLAHNDWSFFFPVMSKSLTGLSGTERKTVSVFLHSKEEQENESRQEFRVHEELYSHENSSTTSHTATVIHTTFQRSTTILMSLHGETIAREEGFRAI